MATTTRARGSRFLFLALLLLLSAPFGNAQSFGRNKVQWEKFDFKVLRTDHFDIYYYDREKEVIQDVGRMAERWYSRLSRVFDHEFQRKPFVIYANSADFQQTTTTSGFIGEGTGGFTDSYMNRVVMPLSGSYAENDHVIGHELVHVFQFELAAKMSRNRRQFSMEALPLWIIEGMAEYFSKGRVDPLTAMWMRDATLHNRLPDFNKLNRDPRYFPYRYGEALMAYIGGRYGDDDVVKFYLVAGSIGPEAAFQRLFASSTKVFFQEWADSSRALYDPILQQRPDYLGEPIIGAGSKDDLNIGPTLSPDGRYVAFLSARELFSIDLFLADAQTGRVLKKLVSSAGSPHIDALRFIDSAGGWSPDSKKLAFVIFERGDNRLAIIDVDSGEIERIKVPGVDALSNPAWSPDGVTVVFSGQSTGQSDLITYNLQTKDVRQLTNDKFADLQPAFSPDGRTIAFVSDRGAGTDLQELRYNDMRISTYELASGTIRTLPIFDNARHINPQYSPDGSHLYFISNPGGISDIFRYTPASGALAQMTRVSSGISGITDLAPALTVAARTGDILFTVYRNDDYDIYRLPANTQPQTVTAALGNAAPAAALLPPERAESSTTYTSYLQRPTEGLPAEGKAYETARYRPSLHITYIGPPTLGIGSDQFGYGASGSVHMRFGDVLGRHTVGFTLQGGGSSSTSFANTFGGELFYLNSERRINWGAVASHVPYISGFTRVSRQIVEVDGQEVVADVLEQRRDIQTVDEVIGLAQYPLSRTRRFEINGGYQNLGFSSELQRQIYVGGQLVDDDTFDLADSESIGLFRGGAAFIGDSSIFGFISPIRGTRYRFEAESLNGDLNFQTALADYRRYIYARPFTFAMRGLHFGRYGDDAENNRIRSLYVGQPTLVRGYDFGDISISECEREPGSDACPVFDRLIGSKIGVASAELRVPLFGPKGFGLIEGGFLPTELVAFVDAGGAWTEDEDLELKFESDTRERVPVVSYGAAVRILLSYIPIQLYYAHPVQRPQEDWVFGFVIAPGW